MVTEKIYVNGLSVIAPGMVEREKTLAILRGDEQWQVEPLPKLVADYLPANERRRTTPVIKLALQTLRSLLNSDDDLDQIATVFASSDGDLGVEHKICEALTQHKKIISPIQFHNSVHNAAAGYWAIATSMSSASVSLSAGNGTFAAGLIDAITQVICEQKKVLFVAYDVVAPAPLDAARHFDYSLGIALRLGIKSESQNLGCIRISLDQIENEVTPCLNRSLEPLRQGNPIGAGLPLLEELVRKSTSSIVIPYIMDKLLQVNLSQ